MEPHATPGNLRAEVPGHRRSRPRGPAEEQPDQPRSTPGSRHGYSVNKYAHTSRNHRPCRTCGQIHSHHEPHLYNYTDEVDEDLMCQICLQPFVQPVDTPCAHTFCHVCISNYMKINPLCPLDRKPLSERTINPTNLVLKRYWKKYVCLRYRRPRCVEQKRDVIMFLPREVFERKTNSHLGSPKIVFKDFANLSTALVGLSKIRVDQLWKKDHKENFTNYQKSSHQVLISGFLIIFSLRGRLGARLFVIEEKQGRICVNKTYKALLSQAQPIPSGRLASSLLL